MCGNLNGVMDDYVTSDGTDVSNDIDKYNLIGDSWQVAPLLQSQTLSDR